MGIVLLLSLVAGCVDIDTIDTRVHHALRFDTDVATPIADDVPVIDAIAADVANSDGPICVLGATDEVGGDDDNLVLGSARAVGVIDALVARGIDRSRFSWQSIGESRLGRSVVVVFDRAVPVSPIVDVLDLPTVPADIVGEDDDDDDDAQTNRRVAKKKAPPPSPQRGFIDGLDVEWRRPAGALVVAIGAACGAGAGLGLCCVAPFTAPIGVTVAAGAVDEAAELDAMSGAGIGAAIGGVGSVIVLGTILGTLGRERVAAPLVVASIAAVPVGGVIGAGVGAAVGWWNSPSGRALAGP